MNNFADEIKELIDRYRDHPGVALEELIDVLDSATEELIEEVNARG
jgi:hypothetical protein